MSKNLIIFVSFILGLFFGFTGYFYLSKPNHQLSKAVEYERSIKAGEIDYFKNPLFLKKFNIDNNAGNGGYISITGSWDAKDRAPVSTTTIKCYQQKKMCLVSDISISKAENNYILNDNPRIFPIKYWNENQLVTLREEGSRCLIERLVIDFSKNSVQMIENSWDSNVLCKGQEKVKNRIINLKDGI